MRRRRLERCLVRAEVAIEAGFPEDARIALEEAKRLDPYEPQIVLLEARLEPETPTAEPDEAGVVSRRTRWGLAVAAVLIVGVGGLAGWGLSRRTATAPESPTTEVRDVVLPALQPVATSGSAIEVRTEELAVRTIDSGPVPSAPEPRAEPQRAAVVESMREALREPEPPPFKPSGVQPVGGIPAAPPPAPPSLPIDAVNAAALPIANTTPAPPPVDEPARVRSVLGRYEAAYTNLDAGAAQSVWPGVDAGALARAFGSLESQRVSLGRCDVSVSGATARANCSGSASWRPKVGTGRTQPRRWDFTLQNAAGSWQIVSVQAR